MCVEYRRGTCVYEVVTGVYSLLLGTGRKPEESVC